MMNDVAKTTEKQTPVKLGVTKAAITKLRKKYGEITPKADTKEGYAQCQGAIRELRTTRTGIEEKRKVLVSDAIAWQRRVNEEAKDLIGQIKEIEAPFQDAKKAEDERKAREKAEAEAREQRRVEEIEARVEEINGMVSDLLGADVETLEARLAEVNEIKITDDIYMEFVEPASMALARVKQQITAGIESAKAMAAQQEQMRKQQEQMDKQQAELDAQQAKIDEANRKKEEEERKKQAEKDRKAREKALSARLPEDLKMRDYADQLVSVQAPDVKSPEMVAILRVVSEQLADTKQYIYDNTQDAA